MNIIILLVLALHLTGWNEVNVQGNQAEAVEWNILNEAQYTEIDLMDKRLSIYYSFPVGSTKEYVLYAGGDGQAFLIYSDEKKNILSYVNVDAADAVMPDVPTDTAYMTVIMKYDNARGSFLLKTDAGGEERLLAVVSKDEAIFGKGIYGSISEALDNISDNGTIVVMPGVYNENVRAWKKAVNIYGTDKEKCVIETYDSSYYNPPLEIAAGSVKNMTINARDKGSSLSQLKAYGIHVESHLLYNNSLIIENCDISSDFNSAVGIGLRGGCDVVFKNVNMTGLEYGIFCHDSAYSTYSGVQNITLEGCNLYAQTGKYVARFDSQGVKNARVNITFINNNINEADADIEVRNNGGYGSEDNWRGLKNYYLDKKSR